MINIYGKDVCLTDPDIHTFIVEQVDDEMCKLKLVKKAFKSFKKDAEKNPKARAKATAHAQFLYLKCSYAHFKNLNKANKKSAKMLEFLAEVRKWVRANLDNPTVKEKHIKKAQVKLLKEWEFEFFRDTNKNSKKDT